MALKYSEYVLPPAGVQPAVLAEVTFITEPDYEWIDGRKHAKMDKKTGQQAMAEKCILSFELAAKMEDGRRFIITRDFYASISPTNGFGKFIASWSGRGDKLNKEQIQEWMSLLNLEGKVKERNVNCVLTVVHKTATQSGREYARIDGIAPPMDGIPRLTVSDDYTPYNERMRNAEASEANEGQPKPAGTSSAPTPSGKDPLIPF